MEVTSPLPVGTVTFLFTDIEGSTRLLQQLGARYLSVLEDHHRLIREVVQNAGGQVIGTEGDSFFVVFTRASDAVAAAVAAQRALISHSWPEGAPVWVRMGLHTGEPTLTALGYAGLDVHRAARISAAGHGGQVLLSQTTRDLVEQDLPAGVSLHDLGFHRLKDLIQPERLFQLLHPDLSATFPPLRSLKELLNNLPQQVTTFIGRQQEMAEVKQRLTSTRLLTLTGAGGTGKSRLALHAAADLMEEFADGVWLVELAPLSDPGLVPQAIATALSVLEQPGLSLNQSLLQHVKGKQLLLILDNCEHLLSACAQLANLFLRHCPQVVLLASSREGLGIEGESLYRVPSLSLPDPEQLSLRSTNVVSSMAQFEAVQLFIDRAMAVQPSFSITQNNARALVEVCYRLDGIPLAIELAAARVRSLTIEEISQRLSSRFRLLTGGSRTALPRQQTLRALIDWSYDLLKEQERQLLSRLSVFCGGWDLEAAEQVCAGGEIQEGEVLDLLTSLVDKSLVVADPHGDRTRYRLLETVRQYALDRLLEGGEGAAVRDRHRNYFLTLAEEAAPQLKGPEQVKWFTRLDVEHDNLRGALEWCREGNEGVEPALRIVGALGEFWHQRGHHTEGRQQLIDALRRGSPPQAVVRGKALYAASRLAWRQGDYLAARAFGQQCLAESQELGDRSCAAYALDLLGIIAFSLDDYVGARTYFERSLALFREVGDRPSSAVALYPLGWIAETEGDYMQAQALYTEALAIDLETGHRGGGALGSLARVTAKQGNHAEAYVLYRQWLAIQREIGNKHYTLEALAGLASLVLEQGAVARAACLFGAVDALQEATGMAFMPLDRERYNQDMATLKAVLVQPECAAAWAQGRAMPLRQMIDYALAESENS